MRLRGIILDWAGTVVDHGSRAPVAALQHVFAAACVPVSVAEARQSMGLAKKEHIRSILEIPRVTEEWTRLHGAAPTETDVDTLYAGFVPKQLDCLAEYSGLISGVADWVSRMRSRGIKIGTTTGYTRPMLEYLLDRAREQGFEPDSSVCPGDVPAGRPAPWMCYLNAIRLEVFPMWALVKIGDTPSDIEEGLNAGMWTIGVTCTGNEVGLTKAEWNGASADQREAILGDAGARLKAAGAHFLAESVAVCDEAIDRIESLLESNQRPF
jgi:phosphonoacetaldehyde hydrolase